MLSALLLYALATVDGALVGYRVASGRSALVDKGSYYWRSILRGALLVQPAIGVAVFVAVLLLLVAADSGRLTLELVGMCQRMLQVYVPYAVVVLVMLALRAVPSTDLRVATSVTVLGPATALRPYVMVAGVLWAALASLRPEILLMATFLAALMLAFEPLLERRRPRV
ncbi:MAG TPA: hypothetical protein VKF16_05085 [Candidatus Dormibacteraeota bacterium]|nr:hypothetical protein [Candidatus Dormibacteraeota bacterium]